MLRAAVIVLFIALLPSHADAEARIALLIGNEAYASEIGRLANPHNDVALLEQALKVLGFEVTVARDTSLGALTRAVNAYARRVQAAGPGAIAFFYYSGHGASDGNTNYLIPIDVKTTETGELWDESLRLTEITRKLKAEAGNATHFVVFDACRNTLKLTQAGSRAVVQSKGFVPVAQENGMLIAYATAEGELASDVGVGAGPYSKVLAEEIVKPGVESVAMFRIVQRRVRATIKQEPYLSFNAMADVYLAGLESSRPIIATPATRCDGIEITVGQNERRCFKPGAGKTEHFQDCPTCPEMVVVPSGHFTMGSPESEPEHVSFESPQHEVTIGKPFAVGRFAVTRGEFATFVKEAEHNTDGGCNTSRWFLYSDKSWRSPGFVQDDRHPVVCVNWGDARAFVVWLSKKTGKTYRLLSEAEREYVARAGTTTPFWWGSAITPKQANYDGSADPYTGGGSKGEYRKRTVAVDSFEANPWGLYDVHGNVWDLTEDCWNANYQGAPADGSAWTSGDCTKRMLRGGSWSDVPRGLRSAVRLWDFERNNKQGFRLARTLNP